MSSAYWGRQAVFFSQLAQGFFLVSPDVEVGARLGTAKEHKSTLFVFRKKAEGIGLIDLAPQEPAGTRDAPTLQAGVGKLQAGTKSRVEKVLIFGHIDDDFLDRRLQSDLVLPQVFEKVIGFWLSS